MLLVLLLLIMAGCAPIEKRVDLTYERIANATGASGEIFVAQPVMKQKLAPLPSGKQIIGKAGDADIVVREDPANWVLSALKQELSAAGFDVMTVAALPADVSKGLQTTVVTLSAGQSSNVLTVTTVTDLRLQVQLWKNGRLVNTLTAAAQDHEEGVDRSSDPIRQALEKTLQRAMQELLPDVIKNLQ